MNYITHGIKALTARAWPSVYKTTKRCVSESIHGKLSKHKSPLRFTYVFTGQRAIAERVLLLNRRSRLYGRGGGGRRGIHTHKATNRFFCVVIIRFYLELPIARKVRRKLNEESTCPKPIHNMPSSYLNSKRSNISKLFFFMAYVTSIKQIIRVKFIESKIL